MQRPRLVSDLLKLARALALDAADTNTLLRAAGHLPLTTLYSSLSPNVQLSDALPSLEQHYRTLLHNACMLILADDARDAAQVQGLLPPVGSAVLITSHLLY